MVMISCVDTLVDIHLPTVISVKSAARLPVNHQALSPARKPTEFPVLLVVLQTAVAGRVDFARVGGVVHHAEIKTSLFRSNAKVDGIYGNLLTSPAMVKILRVRVAQYLHRILTEASV
jgi:hypothetical protein